MTISFTPNQISGFSEESTGFTLINPLSFVATRIDNQNESNYDFILYKSDSSGEAKSQIILKDSKSAESHSITEINTTRGSDWIKSEGRSVHSSTTTTAGDLGSISTKNFAGIFKTGTYKLKIKETGGTEELEALSYDAISNGLIATFANGAKIQLSSPNTIIQIPRYDLDNTWESENSDNGLWAQDLKYSGTNYSKAINTIAKAHPNSFPTGKNVTISAPIEDANGRIKVAFQFPGDSATFGINSGNPLVKQDSKGNYIIRKKGDYKKDHHFPSFEELEKQGARVSGKTDQYTGDYPWYGAFTSDPKNPGTNQSQPFLYLNGALGIDRSKQYDVNLANGTLNNLDPYNRFPDVVGVEGDAFGNFQFVVTLKVPKETVFRPKGGGYDPNNTSFTDFQKSDNTTPGGLEGFKKNSNGTYSFNIPKNQDIPFFNPEIALGMARTVNKDSSAPISFSTWYKNWWEQNTLRDGKSTGGFPWTGRGYTYDPYYPTDDGWNQTPSLGPAVGELVQSWRPKNADKSNWMYEVLDVQTIPEALGASSTAIGADLSLNIKRLGRLDATVYIYEADSITGLLNTAPLNDQGVPEEGKFYYPGDDEYRQQAIKFAKAKIKTNELPEWGEEKNYSFNELNTGKNYGFAIDVEGELFTSYGSTANNFVSLSNSNSFNKTSFTIGFEDTKIGTGDDDFNDLIFTVSNAS